MARQTPLNKTSALMAIRLLAAQAAKLADDLEKGRLWEGDYDEALGQMQRSLNTAKQA
jgi:hypothetical protein